MSVLLKQRYGIDWNPEDAHIHCLAHTTNLIVQKFLSVLSEAPDPDEDDYYISNKHVPIHYDSTTDEVVKALDNEVEGEDEDAGDDDDLEWIEFEFETHWSAIQKVRKIP